jgi:hypothetical protein
MTAPYADGSNPDSTAYLHFKGPGGSDLSNFDLCCNGGGNLFLSTYDEGG